MKVIIKDLAVNMELGNRGVEFEVRDNNGHHLGDLIIRKATIEWCPGRTQKGNGRKMKWEKLIELFINNR